MKKIKGQVLIETALILPLLLLLIFGLVDFGRAIYTKNTLNNAARSGARVASVTPGLTAVSSPLFSASVTGEPANTIKRNIFDGIPKDNSVAYELRILDAAGNPTGTAAISGNEVNVILTWPNFPMITPLYKVVALITNSTAQDSNSLTISGQASMRYE